VVFGALAFFAATGRSVGWGQAEAGSPTATTQPASASVLLLSDVRP
jgi:hypothetical protein